MGMLPPLILSQPGVFNVLDPWYFDTVTSTWVGMVANNPALAARNAAVLQTIINIAQTTDCTNAHPYGAIILFPGHASVPNQQSNGHDAGAVYSIQAPGDGTPAINVNCNWPLRFLGTGNATLAMVIPSMTTPGDMFSIQTNNGQDADIRGITFEDLLLAYPTISGTVPQVAAIHVAAASLTCPNDGGQNVRLIRVILDDCPIGVWFEQALQCSMLECAARYPSNQGTAVKLGNGKNSADKGAAKEIYIAGCVFGVTKGSPVGSIGLQILGADQVFVSDTRIDGFTYGILIEPGPYGKNAVHLSFSKVAVYAGPADMPSGAQAGTALIIQPQGTATGQASNQQIGVISFVDCQFGPGEDANIVTSQGAGVVINQNGSIIDTIRFVSCRSCRWNGPGILVVASSYNGSATGGKLQNIEILGGIYAGNDLHSGVAAPQPYGIAVIGPAANTRIVGTSCIGQYEDVTIGQAALSPPQQVGIYIDQGAKDVLIDGCDITGNGTYGIQIVGETTSVTTNIFIRNCDASGFANYQHAINVSGTVSNVQITNCAGYNDQSTAIAISFPSGSAVFGTAFHPYQLNTITPYYGPMEIYLGSGVTGVTAVKINTNTTHLTSGSFFVNPSDTVEIDGGTPILFLAIAK
jgi:hypothetical protein